MRFGYWLHQTSLIGFHFILFHLDQFLILLILILLQIVLNKLPWSIMKIKYMSIYVIHDIQICQLYGVPFISTTFILRQISRCYGAPGSINEFWWSISVYKNSVFKYLKKQEKFGGLVPFARWYRQKKLRFSVSPQQSHYH